MTTYKLPEVATIERAKKGKIYPKNSTLIQVSATQGNVEYLKEDSEVDGKFAVITPNNRINPKYLNIMVNRNIGRFLSRYQSGLNIQIADLKHMEIEIHEKQDEIARNIEIIEREEEKIEKEIEILQTTKSRFLRDLLI